ncbi:MAG: substrate-binding domain-containing protein [Kiritimatiellia bacterium]
MADSKYKALLRELKAKIIAGGYDGAHPFPSESAMARELALSRNTVHRAFQELRRLQLIEGGVGVVPTVTHRGTMRKIGLMVPGLAYSEFFQPIIRAVSRLAMKHGYTLIFGSMEPDNYARGIDRARKYAESLIAEGVAGIICQPLEFVDKMAEANAEIMSVFEAAKIPVVLIDYDIVPAPDRSKYDLVGIDNHLAGFRLANHLLAQGARRIDFLMRPNCSWSVHRRFDGVCTAAFRHGHAEVRRIVADPGDVAKIRSLFRRRRPDAVVCGNDAVAALFKQTAERLSLRVPDDLLLAGFDDVSIASLLSPPLTTIRQPCREIGESAFMALVGRMHNPGSPVREIYLDAPLAVRRSTERALNSQRKRRCS